MTANQINIQILLVSTDMLLHNHSYIVNSCLVALSAGILHVWLFEAGIADAISSL